MARLSAADNAGAVGGDGGDVEYPSVFASLVWATVTSLFLSFSIESDFSMIASVTADIIVVVFIDSGASV